MRVMTHRNQGSLGPRLPPQNARHALRYGGAMRFASLASGPLVALAACAVSALTGCAPESQYRYTASVPAVRPIAWDGRTPKAGSLGVEGTITHTDMLTNPLPQLHDTAVWVPEWTTEGAAFIALSSRVQLGIRGAYADYAWSRPSAVGTMPVPGAPGSWGLGPELRASFPLEPTRHWWLGIAGNFMSYQVPYAEWTLTGPTSTTPSAPACVPSPTCVNSYSLFDTRTESHWVYNLGLYPSYAVGDHGQYGNVVAMVAATSGFKNDGFTNQPSNGSTVDSVGPIFVLGAGYGYHYDVMHVTGLVYRPITDVRLARRVRLRRPDRAGRRLRHHGEGRLRRGAAPSTDRSRPRLGLDASSAHGLRSR